MDKNPTVNKKEFPEELKKWNWGASLFNFVWGTSHKYYLSLLSLIPVFGIGMIIYLGHKGNEIAWHSREWKSIEEFKFTQLKWTITSIIVFFFVITLFLIFYLK